jgi:hypothetical protein
LPGKPDRGDLAQRLASASSDSRVSVIHVPNGEHPLIQFIAEPMRDDLCRTVELATEDAERSMGKRSHLNRRIGWRSPRHGSDRELMHPRLQLFEQVGLEQGIVGLPLGVSEVEMCRCRIKRTVA